MACSQGAGFSATDRPKVCSHGEQLTAVVGWWRRLELRFRPCKPDLTLVRVRCGLCLTKPPLEADLNPHPGESLPKRHPNLTLSLPSVVTPSFAILTPPPLRMHGLV